MILKYLKIINIKIIVRQPNIIESSLKGSIKFYLLRKFYKNFIKFSDAVIVTSNFMKQEAKKNRVREEKLFIVRNHLFDYEKSINK